MRKFRLPEEMRSRKDRVPVTARIPTEIRTALEDLAKRAGISLAELVSNVLEDYVSYVEGQPGKHVRDK